MAEFIENNLDMEKWVKVEDRITKRQLETKFKIRMMRKDIRLF